jgi:DNA-binding transcriptional LysR family regulator
MGVAYLPDNICADYIASGRLVQVFPDWRSQAGIVHLVFTTKRGLPPAVRALIDYIAGNFPAPGPLLTTVDR